MTNGAGGDRGAQREDPVADRDRIGTPERLERLLGDVVEVGLIPLDQLDDQCFLRREVVVEASREDPARVGDLLQRGSQARRREQFRGGLEDLCSRAPSTDTAFTPSASTRRPHGTGSLRRPRPFVPC